MKRLRSDSVGSDIIADTCARSAANRTCATGRATQRSEEEAEGMEQRQMK